MKNLLLGVSLFAAWACGVNTALGHWSDAVGEALVVALALIVRRYWPETRVALAYWWRRIVG